MCIRCNANLDGADSVAVGHQLPRNVVPLAYDLKLSPDLPGARFDGEVSIDVDVCEVSSFVELHAAELVIHSACAENADGTCLNATLSLDAETERAKLNFAGKLGKGKWTLKLSFSGILNDKLRGFYRSFNKTADGKDEPVAVTQFESTDARRAFPCFDEPELKATFKITLVIDKKLTALSNWPAVKTTVDDATGKKTVEFDRTMKMSTYIVAFVVGNFASSPPVMVDGVELRIWAAPHKIHLAKFGLGAASFSLNYFKRYFNRAYPGPKMDLIAIADFAAGAMENMGCVTYRETALLVDPATASQGSLERVAEVICHENAHMWFGNLVTMKWWTGLWLNEAFATFMAYKAVDAWKKQWGIWDKFALSRSAAMRVDSLKSTRPVEFEVKHPSEAAAMFDVLTYEKGGSVLRMLEQYLGEEVFRKGMEIYMQRHAYSNTETDDLWAALRESSGINVAAIMNGWIFKSGFPVLTVKKSDIAGFIEVTQRPFKFLQENVDEDQTWSIPFFLRTSRQGAVEEHPVLLTTRGLMIYIGDDMSKLDYIVLNAGGHSFVRVDYAPELASLLAKNLDKLSVLERYSLLSDTWACVRAGLSGAVEFVDVAKLFSKEEDPSVWAAILGPLSTIHSYLPEANRPTFEATVRDLLRPTHERLGWEAKDGESIQTRELRADMIAALGATGNDTSVVAEAKKRYVQWKADPKSIDANIVGAVVGLTAHHGDAVVYNEFYQLYRNAATPQDESRFLGGLARFRDEKLLGQTLALALDPKAIRTQDAPFTVAGVMSNQAGSKAAWEFIKANWDKMVELYPSTGLVRMCGAIVNLDDPASEKEVHKFFADRSVEGGEKALEQYFELLRVNVLFRQRASAPLAAAYTPPAAPATGKKDANTATCSCNAAAGGCSPSGACPCSGKPEAGCACAQVTNASER